jgi:hypothetical protein
MFGGAFEVGGVAGDFFEDAVSGAVREAQALDGGFQNLFAFGGDGAVFADCRESRRPLSEVAFVLHEHSQLLAVAGFPVAQVSFQDDVGGLEDPAQFGLVRKSNAHVEHSFLKDVFGPVYNLASQAGVLLAQRGSPSG